MSEPFADHGRAHRGSEAQVLWDMVDGPMPRGVLGVGDPDVHHIGDRWTMFVGGFSTSFRNRLYKATLTEGASLGTGTWEFERDSHGRAAAIVPDPPRGSWDAGGMHTPSYVPATRNHDARIYYTGRATSKQYGPGSQYSIGVLEKNGNDWVRHNGPIVRGHAPRSSVLEPFVVYSDGRYRLWYQANPHEIGPGEQPDYELRCTESENGLTNWSPPQVFADASEGFFDNCLAWNGKRWIMLLARGSNLHNTADFPEQGLWWMTASHPSTNREAWSTPQRLLDTDAAGTPDWFARGTYGPALAFENPESARATIWFTGTRYGPRWPLMALQRLARFRRPPVPSPFFLSTGVMELDPATDVSR